MATKGKSSVDVTAQSCGVCGGTLSTEGECTTCGTKHELGANGTMVPVPSNGPPRSSGSDNGLTKWLSGESSDTSLQAWLGGASQPGSGAPQDSNTEALRKWLTGEEGAFDEWLGGTVTVAEAAPPGDAGRRIKELQGKLDERERDLRSRDIELDGLRAELGAFKKTVSSELSTFRSGRFDPVKYIEDSANLNKNLQTEIAKRKELEEEIDHIKKGSIAVIKYVKAQQLKSGAAPDVKKRLVEESAARKQLEIQLQKNQEVVTALKAQVEKNLLGKPLEFRELKNRELALVEKEAGLRAKEAEAQEAARRGAAEGPGGGEELRERFTAEIREKEQEFLKKEDELKKRIILLEEDVNKFKIEDRLRTESAQLKGKPKGEVDVVFAKKEQELQTKERSILLRESEIQRLKEELLGKEDEMKRLKEPLGYKEEELLRREEDLVYRERLLQAERTKVEHAKALGGGTGELELKERLELLKGEIAQKEEEVRAKEKYLKSKMEELRLREQGLIEEEIEAREEERQLEVKQEKVKTGTPRLDDLLLGGIPFGTNVTAYGPAHVGKEVIVDAFMAEGLRKGVPIIWVLTDKMAGDVRQEMAFVLPGYEEYEKLGLVKYVDAYSKSMGADTNDPNTTYVNDLTDFAATAKAVDAVSTEFKKKHAYYRLAFRSVSTLIAYLDPTTTFKFLQPFVGRRKRDKAVALYVIEKGMHEEKEIEMLSSMMDGTFEFKVEQLRSFMAVRGVCDVQSRAYIKYTHSRSAVSIGSFSLEMIK
ncbi:MAG TPA: ATPase domain-containing protein [Thermoplasmata archaeon]|nr:ATPase domain-containing protein [Thermoplasmata archaeon]